MEEQLRREIAVQKAMTRVAFFVPFLYTQHILSLQCLSEPYCVLIHCVSKVLCLLCSGRRFLILFPSTHFSSRSHKHVVKLVEVMKTARHIYVVLELITGAYLFGTVLLAFFAVVSHVSIASICHLAVQAENYSTRSLQPNDLTKLLPASTSSNSSMAWSIAIPRELLTVI